MEAEPGPWVPAGNPGASTEAGCLQLAAIASLLVGLLLTVIGVAHLLSVIVAAMTHGYPYNFRLASLLLVGLTLIFGAALCLSAVLGLVRRQRAAWGRAVIGTLLLLLVLVPMGPVQPDMAPGLSFFAGVNLITLLAVWRGLET